MISVVIPTKDRVPDLLRCLHALAMQDARSLLREVVVVDDHSHSPSPDEILRFASERDLPVRHVSNSLGSGAATARNRGAAYASGAILGFLDDDSIPRADWLRQVKAALEGQFISAVTGRILPLDEINIFSRARQLRYEQRQAQASMPDGQSVDFLAGGNCALWRRDFEECGGFDPAFVLMHDRELALRLKKKGRLCAYVHGLTVWHKHHKNARIACLRCVQSASYRLALENLYPDMPRWSWWNQLRSIWPLWGLARKDRRDCVPFAVATGLEALHGLAYVWYRASTTLTIYHRREPPV